MRYAATHKQDTRDKLVASSSAIAKKGGFATTGVDALMAAIGLSGGAFYSHFGSKDQLFAAVVEQQIAHSAQLLDASAGRAALRKLLRAYLSSTHARQPEAGCALPALGAEIARADPAVRATVEAGLKQLQRGWAEQLGESTGGAADAGLAASDRAWALLSQCVGALVLARVVDSERTRQEILAANRRVAEQAVAD